MSREQGNTKVDILDVPLYARNIDDATALVIRECQGSARNNYCMSATGAHGLVFASKNPMFKDILRSFYINLPDGMPGVWIGRLKGARQMQRCYGPSFFESVLTGSANTTVSHFFCGGNEGVAEELKASVAAKFGNHKVVGTYCPPFLKVEDYDYSAIAKKIDQTNANIVWIGLSTPKQEVFAYHLSKFTSVNFIISVGAAFDFHTGKVRQAPSAVQKIGLEWLFRLMMEPKRLYKRYFEIVPGFIYLNLKEFFTFTLQKNPAKNK